MSPHRLQEAALAINIACGVALLYITGRNSRSLRRIKATERCLLATAMDDITPRRHGGG